jgi:two-component system, OmpR family, sensor histidine kinase KdpD
MNNQRSTTNIPYPAPHGKPGMSETPARVLACISDQPAAQQVIRAAARIATERRAELYALYVEQPGHSTRCQPKMAAQFASNTRLAHDLGAQVEIAHSHRVVETILQFAREHEIGLIVLGRSEHARRRLFGEDLADRVRKSSGAIEVCVIDE